jgi:hypothetical protein
LGKRPTGNGNLSSIPASNQNNGGEGVGVHEFLLRGVEKRLKTGRATHPNGRKKTVSNQETAAGQQPEKTETKSGAESEKPTAAKTFRSFRGPLVSRVPRFVNWCLG